MKRKKYDEVRKIKKKKEKKKEICTIRKIMKKER